MSRPIKAPELMQCIEVFKDGKFKASESDDLIINDIFSLLNKISRFEDKIDKRWKLWLQIDRGTIDDYGSYEEAKEWGEVSSYKEFEEEWKWRFPNKEEWILLWAIEHKDDNKRFIFLNRELVYRSDGEWVYDYNYPKQKRFYKWILYAVSKSIKKIEKNTYNKYVDDNLPYKHRTGVIARKDMWEINPEMKKEYFKELTTKEFKRFIPWICQQKDNLPVGKYIKNMTAKKFYDCCALGYKANKYDGLEGLSSKEQYYKKADRRDEGLSEIKLNSSKEFEEWYNDRERSGGHPWEVVAGGNSTHIDLFVCKNENGYYFAVRGKAYWCTVESIKFYNALRENNIAVVLEDAEEIKRSVLGEDEIGIVPHDVFPRYCESMFPGKDIILFEHLPYEEDELNKMLPKITWLKEEEQFLI